MMMIIIMMVVAEVMMSLVVMISLMMISSNKAHTCQSILPSLDSSVNHKDQSCGAVVVPTLFQSNCWWWYWCRWWCWWFMVASITKTTLFKIVLNSQTRCHFSNWIEVEPKQGLCIQTFLCLTMENVTHDQQIPTNAHLFRAALI